MKTKMIEATEPMEFNWGKFMVGRFDADEWQVRSAVSDLKAPLLYQRGWTPEHLLVLDLETGEGAIFLPGKNGLARADLDKHQVWVCPMFEPFLGWLYQQDLSDLDKLPAQVVRPERDADVAARLPQGKKVRMNSITITFENHQIHRLTETAKRLGMSLTDLLKAIALIMEKDGADIAEQLTKEDVERTGTGMSLSEFFRFVVVPKMKNKKGKWPGSNGQ